MSHNVSNRARDNADRDSVLHELGGMMPWKSDKQRRWGHSKSGVKALGGKKKVEEFDKASKKSEKKKHR